MGVESIKDIYQYPTVRTWRRHSRDSMFDADAVTRRSAQTSSMWKAVNFQRRSVPG